LSDKDFKVKNKLQVKGITSAGPVVSDASGNLDSTAYIATQYGGTGTSTSPTSGQILYSASGSSYAPTTLSSLVTPVTYSTDAPSSPVTGQVWIESDSLSDSFDPNIIRRQSFTATAGQTVFTTAIAFIDGYEQVYFNGLLLLRTTDYTTSNSNTITLASAAAANDIVEVVTVTNLNSVNTYTQAEIDSALSAKLSTSTAASTYLTQSNASSTYLTQSNASSTYSTIASPTFTGTQTIQGTSSSSFGVNISQTDTSSLMRVGFDNSSGLAQIGNWSNNSLRFLTNASERMRIDSSGNIGIGVSSPTSKLHVETSGTNYITSRNGAAGAGIAGLILQNSGDTRGIRINGSSLELYDHSAGAARMVVDASGRVGIGTSSPDRVLNISYAGATIGISNTSVGGGSMSIDAPSSGLSQIDIAGSNAFRINTNSSERMRIAADGTFSVSYVDASAPRFINTPNNNNKLMVFEGYAGGLWNLWGGHGGGSYFGISENASTTPVFAITGTTNYVLVGYTSSQGAYKLQVNSQIFATSSSIATSDGRYKENVDTITGGLDIIDSLRPVSFTWKDHPVHNFVEGKTVGFIAQEVKESLSQYDWVDNIIKTNTSDAILDEDGNEVTPAEEFLGIAESNIIPLLVSAVKELKARVENLEAN
jgi:Chaperone of endosialidase